MASPTWEWEANYQPPTTKDKDKDTNHPSPTHTPGQAAPTHPSFPDRTSQDFRQRPPHRNTSPAASTAKFSGSKTPPMSKHPTSTAPATPIFHPIPSRHRHPHPHLRHSHTQHRPKKDIKAVPQEKCSRAGSPTSPLHPPRPQDPRVKRHPGLRHPIPPPPHPPPTAGSTRGTKEVVKKSNKTRNLKRGGGRGSWFVVSCPHLYM